MQCFETCMQLSTNTYARYSSTVCLVLVTLDWMLANLSADSEDLRRQEFFAAAKEVTDFIIKKGWDHSMLRTLPFGFALPIQEMIHALKECPPEGPSLHSVHGKDLCRLGWSTEGYMLIDREDIIATIGPEPDKNTSPEENSVLRYVVKEKKLCSRSFKSRCGQMPRSSSEAFTPVTSTTSSSLTREKLGDGLDDVIDSIGTQRFSSDNRIDKVSLAELLCGLLLEHSCS